MFKGEAGHAKRRSALLRSVESIVVEHRADRGEQFVGPGEHLPQEFKGVVVAYVHIRTGWLI